MAFALRGAGAFLRMLSSASLLFILKSGCLNSQAYRHVSLHLPAQIHHNKTYPDTVRRCSSLLIVVPYFMKVILVQLTYKAGKVAVFEMFRQDVLGEFLVLLKN